MGQDDRSLNPSRDEPSPLRDHMQIDAENAVRELLNYIGEDHERDGLQDTPRRVTKAWREMTAGYKEDPAEILSRVFDETSDEMVMLNGIQFYSTCEHHMLPFMGEACVAYLPASRVVGISKLARVVSCFARRLQIQERMTSQIANAIQEHLQPDGVAVVLRAHHLCMGCRGVKQSTTEMVTSALLGKFRDPSVRSEFLQLSRQRHAS